MDVESVTPKLPRQLSPGAQPVASARDVTIGHMVRVLLKREIERRAANSASRPDPRFFAALVALLGPDMAAASAWPDLGERLRPHGYQFRATDGGMMLFKTSCGTRVCKASDLGAVYRDFVRRVGSAERARPASTAHLGVMPAGNLDDRRLGLLRNHVMAAADWSDLIRRLRDEGLDLRPTGADLGIFRTATGRHMCNTGTLGAHYRTLVQRFGGAMPGAADEEKQPSAGSRGA